MNWNQNFSSIDHICHSGQLRVNLSRDHQKNFLWASRLWSSRKTKRAYLMIFAEKWEKNEFRVKTLMLSSCLSKIQSMFLFKKRVEDIVGDRKNIYDQSMLAYILVFKPKNNPFLRKHTYLYIDLITKWRENTHCICGGMIDYMITGTMSPRNYCNTFRYK